MDKVVVIGKRGFRTVIHNLSKIAPKIRDFIRDFERMVLIVIHSNVEDSIALSISIEKIVIEPMHINFVDGSYKK